MQDPNTYGQAANETPEAALENAWGAVREAIRVAGPDGERRRREASGRYDALVEQLGQRAQGDPERFENRAPLIHEFAADAVEIMWRRANGLAKPLPTPFPLFSEAMGGGWWPGAYILSSTTGAGKSQWALQCALEAALNGAPVLYLGLELEKAQIVARLMSLLCARRDPIRAPFWSNLYLGTDAAALERASKELPSIPRHFHAEFPPPMRAWTADQLVLRVREMRAKYPETEPGSQPMFVVLDYLQIVGSREGAGHQDLRERVGEAAYMARQVAREYGAVVLVISSISRDNAKILGDPKTQFGHCEAGDFVGFGKESGEIEYSADGVLTMAVMDRGGVDGRKTVGMALAKVRAGKTSWAYYSFNGSWFEPREAPPPPPPPPPKTKPNSRFKAPEAANDPLDDDEDA